MTDAIPGKTWPWGKAGVRRDGRRPASARAQHARVASDERGYRNWRGGHMQPHSITMWLDAADLHGPEVDAALGVEEPTVDEWEAGIRYPTWEQTKALAKLCNVSPECLTRTRPTPPALTSLRFHRREWEQEPPVMRFRQEAIAATISEETR